MKSRDCRGVTLTELMIATVILSTVILGSMSAFGYITKAIHNTRQRTIAVNIAQERMEVLKNYSYFQLLVTTDAVTDVLPHDPSMPVAELKSKPTQDRFVSSVVEEQVPVQPAKSTKTAEAAVPTGGTAAPSQNQPQK